jgi:hypothetical protein
MRPPYGPSAPHPRLKRDQALTHLGTLDFVAATPVKCFAREG